MLKKTILSMMAVVLAFGTFLPNMASAQIPAEGIDIPTDIQEMHFETLEEANAYIEEVTNAEFTTSAGAVAVFVGGIIVAFMIDGIVINMTDFSIAQWQSILVDWTNCQGWKERVRFSISPDGTTGCWVHFG